MRPDFPNQQECFIGVVQLAATMAKEGLDGDRIEEAVAALSSLSLFSSDELVRAGEDLATMWLRVQVEASEFGLSNFFDAVASKTSSTTKSQIFKVCFDLISSNPHLDAADNDFLKLLIKKFAMPADSAAQLQRIARTPVRYRLHRNTLYGVSIEIPETWLINDLNDGIKILSAQSPKQNSFDEFADHVNLYIDEEARGQNLDQYHDMNLSIWKDVYVNFSLKQSGQFHLADAGIGAKWVLFTADLVEYNRQLLVRFYSIVSDRHSFPYALRCNSLPNSYSDFETIYEHIAKSIRITPP